MATTEEMLLEAQNQFNEKYGVEFDIEAFETKSNFNQNMGGLDANFLYRQAFTSLYKKAFAMFVDGRLKNNTLDVGEMINDFENVMGHYRTQCNETKRTQAPVSYGGWTTGGFLEAAYDALKPVSDDKPNYAARRYLDRDIRIRDMRSFAESLQNAEGEPSVSDLATLYCYAEGLSKVHKERSALFKIIHPFRYRAEAREAKNFKNYIAQATGGELEVGKGNDKFEQILAHVNSDLIKTSRRTIKNALNQAKLAEEQKREQEEKEREAREPISEKIKKKLVADKGYYAYNLAVAVGNKLPENDMDLIAKVGSLEVSVGSAVVKKMESINKDYEKAVANGADPKEQMKQLIKDVWQPASESLHSIGTYDQKDKMAITQLIVDNVLKDLSPAAFDPQQFGEFTKGYVLKNPDMFADILNTEENPEIANEAKKAYTDMTRERVKFDNNEIDNSKGKISAPVEESKKLEKAANTKTQ